MSVTENDLELLEEHLDGALDGAAIMDLNRRVAGEAQLADALAQATADRAVRNAVWQSIEPDKAASDRLLWRIRGAMLDQQQKKPANPAWKSWKIASLGSAAAACLMVGFLAGRVGQGGSVPHPAPNAVVNPGGQDVAMNTSQNLSGQTAGQFNRVGRTPQILVPISNEYGQVVRWQPFDNPEQAASFEADLNKASAPTIAPKLASQEQEHF
jgi:hypothetical protein